MGCQSDCQDFVDQALKEIKLSKSFAHPNEFNDSFLFGIEDPNYASMKQMRSNWINVAPTLFANCIRKMASEYSIQTFDLPFEHIKHVGFGYMEGKRRRGCIMLWPNIKHSPLDRSEKNAAYWAHELVKNKVVNDVFLVWLTDASNAKLRERLNSWNESYSLYGIKHISALEWVQNTFGQEAANCVADAANRIKAEGRLIQGFTVVALPTVYEYESFRREAISNYVNCELPLIEERMLLMGMPEHDLDVLKRNVLHDNHFEVLFGCTDFAASFLSSEWRYKISSLSDSVEQTGTAVGYIKAVEQMLFHLLTLWIDSGFDVVFSEKTTAIPTPLTTSLLAKNKGKVTLGSLRHLYSSRQHDSFNKEIYDSEMNIGCFRELLFQRLESFNGDTRNGKLHKSNFYDLDKVREIRNEVLDITFMLLGGIRLSASQCKLLDDMKQQIEIAPNTLADMARDLNEGIEELTLDSLDDARLLANKCGSEPPMWQISLIVKTANVDIRNYYYYSPLRGLSQEDELGCVNSLIESYLTSDFVFEALRKVLTEYAVFGVESSPLHVPLK